MKAIKSLNYGNILVVTAGVILAIALRYSLLGFKSVDYLDYTRVWFNTIKADGFSSFGRDFSNYNLPYLYLLYIIARFLPDVPALIATKIPSLIADFITAWFAFQIVRLKYQNSPLPLFAMFAILFSPNIILNSAFWGQADMLYTAALVASIYFLMARKHILATILFGISISFKAQAVFLSPLLFALFLRKEIPWKHFLLIPLMMILALVPAWIAGRSLWSLLLIYPSQADQYQQLSMNAPSFFSWFPDTGSVYRYFYPFGLILAAAAGFFFSICVYKSKAEMTDSVLLELALISVMLMPFVLPKMHDRYFYPADVISIIFAFYFPAYFYVPIIMNTVSFFVYQPTLFGVEPVPINLLAFGVLGLLIILSRHIAKQPGSHNSETKSPQAGL